MTSSTGDGEQYVHRQTDGDHRHRVDQTHHDEELGTQHRREFRRTRDAFEEILGAMARANFLRLVNAVFEKDGKTIPYRKASLTPDGEALIGRVLPAHVAGIREVFSVLTGEDRAQLTSLSKKLGLALREREQAEPVGAGRRRGARATSSGAARRRSGGGVEPGTAVTSRCPFLGRGRRKAAQQCKSTADHL